MDVVDSLGLEIRASSNNATKAIRSLTRALATLDNALSRFNGSQGYVKGITQTATGINKLSSSINSIDGAKLKSIATSMRGLSKVDGSTANFGKITQELKKINSVQVDSRNADSLAKVGKAMQGLSQSSKAADGIPRVVNAIKGMGNIKIPNISSISAFGDGVKKLSNATRASENIPKIASALRGLSSLKNVPNMAWIKPFAEGISKLGGKYTAQAIDRLPRLATSIRRLLTELRSVGRVDRNTIRLVNSLATLTRAGYRANTSMGNASRGLNLFSTSCSRATRLSFSLASAIGRVYATYWLLFRLFGKLGQAINLSAQLTEVQNVVDVTFGDMKSKVQDLANTSIRQFGMSELSVKQYASRFQAMGTAMNIQNKDIQNMSSNLDRLGIDYAKATNSVADMSIELTKLTADIASFYDIEQADVAQDLQAIYTGMTRPLTLAA